MDKENENLASNITDKGNKNTEFWRITFLLSWGLCLVLFIVGCILGFLEIYNRAGNFIVLSCIIFSLASLLSVLYVTLKMFKERKIVIWKITLLLIWLSSLSFFTYMSVFWWLVLSRDKCWSPCFNI